ncbi:MAG: mandelate racemase/muconate lactonizing enzyme family protein [Chloroflexota bacterium]
MKIVDIYEGVIPISSSIRNAYVDFSKMTASMVAVESDVIREGKPLVGFGFNSNGRYAQGGILRERILPRLHQASESELLSDDGQNIDPFKAWDVMMTNEKPGGHGDRSVAVGVIDMALWDLVAKIEEKSLSQLLADRYCNGEADSDVEVYAAGGYYYPGKGLVQLQDEMRRYLDMGYTKVKMKIGGTSLADDLERIEAVINIVGDGANLAVDANGRFDLKTAVAYAEAMEPYDLRWYEEPGDPLDYQLNAVVVQSTSTPIATGENLFSRIDTQNLIRYGGMSPSNGILQMDPVLSYGLVEYMRMLEMLTTHGWSWRRCIPHGGHQMALNIAAGLGLGGNESYPEVFQPIGGFADTVPVIDGRVRIPDAPGIGFELKGDLIDVLRQLRD